jgi:fructuronate reductase/mannitol 2-dehydrogenase
MWVIEDTFSNERPPLDAVGAVFVDDVEAFARAKRRMLNGGHSALGYIGYLLGHRTTDQAMADPRVATYLDRLLADEIAPILEEPRGFALDDFRATLLERFANPRLGDRLARLCGRGSTKMPAYLLPSLAEARAEGRRIDLLALAVAAWFIYLRGYDLDGRLIRVVDPCTAEIQPLARASTEDPRVLLGVDRIFGDLGSDPGVVGAIEDALESIRTDGLGATVWRYAQAGTATVAA